MHSKLHSIDIYNGYCLVNSSQQGVSDIHVHLKLAILTVELDMNPLIMIMLRKLKSANKQLKKYAYESRWTNM
jgi:hypothetical protein